MSQLRGDRKVKQHTRMKYECEVVERKYENNRCENEYDGSTGNFHISPVDFHMVFTISKSIPHCVDNCSYLLTVVRLSFTLHGEISYFGRCVSNFARASNYGFNFHNAFSYFVRCISNVACASHSGFILPPLSLNVVRG